MAEDGHRHLKAVVLLVGYVGLVGCIHVAHDHPPENLTAEVGRAGLLRSTSRPSGLLNRLARHIHDESKRFFRLQVESAGDELVTVRVDQVAGDVFPDGQRGIPT